MTDTLLDAPAAPAHRSAVDPPHPADARSAEAAEAHPGDAAAAPPRFKPYVLWRRGMLAPAELSALVPDATWARLEALERARALRDRQAAELGDHLHARVPALGPDERRAVLSLRRDVHNDRLPRGSAIDAARTLLDAEGRALLDAWLHARRAADEDEAAADACLAGELARARRRLGEIASGEHFLKGVQLSGTHLYRGVRAYAASVLGGGGELRWTKQQRALEATVLRYAYRMALRTSPFASFTEIGAQPWDAPAGPADERGGRRHVVRLNRSLVAWMVYELRHLEGSDDFLLLRLNDTLQPTEGALEAFTRGVDGGPKAYWGERFVSARRVGALGVVTAALVDGPRTRGDVLRRLAERGVPPEKARPFVDGLVEAGICHQDLAIPDQASAYTACAARALRDAESPGATAGAEVFEALDRVEREFGAAPVERREALLGEVEGGARRLAALCGVEAPLEVARSLVFEDVGAAAPARSWNAARVERCAAPLALLQRILPVFDDTTLEKLGLHHWFVSRYGEGGRCDDVLSLYRAFAEQPAAEVSAVARGGGSPAAARVLALRDTLLRRLDRAVAQAGDAPALHLDPRCLRDAADAVPAGVPRWTEASYRLQLAPAEDGGEPLVVVNDATSGHGVFFSRFCDLVEPAEDGGWSLAGAIRGECAATHPRQADLTAVLGLNINLHPRLTPLEVVYPGSLADGGQALTLRDLAVEADPATRSLRLVERDGGRPVLLTPMNFLFPAAAPMLYRFLCMLAPLHGFRVGVWDRLRQASAHNHAYLPRLVLDGLVLERRRWYRPLADAGALGDGTAPDTPRTLRAAEEWRARHGLPRESFFRLHERPAGPRAAGDWMDETRQWALNARRARRKGQYLDFRNPFLVHLLAQQAAATPGGTAMFQECLPSPAAWTGGAEEFLVELRVPGPGDAP